MAEAVANVLAGRRRNDGEKPNWLSPFWRILHHVLGERLEQEPQSMDLKEYEQPPHLLLGAYAHAGIALSLRGSVPPPHAVIEVQNMCLDLVAHIVTREMRHLEHVYDVAGISVAPVDQLAQDLIEV